MILSLLLNQECEGLKTCTRGRDPVRKNPSGPLANLARVPKLSGNTFPVCSLNYVVICTVPVRLAQPELLLYKTTRPKTKFPTKTHPTRSLFVPSDLLPKNIPHKCDKNLSAKQYKNKYHPPSRDRIIPVRR